MLLTEKHTAQERKVPDTVIEACGMGCRQNLLGKERTLAFGVCEEWLTGRDGETTTICIVCLGAGRQSGAG